MLEIDLQGGVGGLEIDVKLAVGAGPLALVGPNGSGKTTLLHMILGVLRPRAGRVVLDGDVLFDAARGIDVPIDQRRLGYLPQHYALFPHMTVLENVAAPLGWRRPAPPRAARRDQAMALLADLGIADLAARRPATLSGGERQRAALARALAAGPRALLLDEPLAAADVAARRTVRRFLRETLTRLALPAIVVTHEPADAAALAERIAVLEAGRLVQTGALAELAAAPATPFVAELVTPTAR
jgi:molybdate transport system ATP-binding protein